MEPLTLGTVITIAKELLSLLVTATKYAHKFRKEFKQLEGTLNLVASRFEKEMHLELDHDKRAVLEEIHKKLIDGKTLIKNCRKVRWNLPLRIYYCRELKKLNGTILNFCQTGLQFDTWANTRQSLRNDEEMISMLREALQQHQQQQQGLTLAVNPSSNKGFFAVPKVTLDIGLNLHVLHLRNKLFAESVTVLGLSAPAGSGKSTLAAKLCQDPKVEGTFKDNIFFVTVSRTSTLEILSKLVEEIGGEKLTSDLSEEEARKQFHDLLKKRTSEPLLLVLDDVLDETVIEKFFFKTEGFKILVTSRERFNIYDSEYYLEPLDEKDSETLFRQILLSQDGNKEFVPDQKLLKQIVRCCNGIPLVITVIAKSLSLQPTEKWTDMARTLLKHSSNLINSLAISLDTLDDIVLTCFLDLGSFPEDKWIPASTLIDIWCEIYELHDGYQVLVILLELASRSLINLVGIGKFVPENDSSFNEVFVIQHDVLRELAIRQSRQKLTMDSTEGLLGSLRKEENHYLGGRIVSLGTGEISPESLSNLQPSEVEVLILNIKASEYALPQFIEKMINLKVLIIVNYKWTRAKLSNLITLTKLANLKRIRLEKLLIPSLHEITLSLMNLQKITLFMCDFDQSLMNRTIDASSKLPNLVEISIEYCHNLVKLPPWICDIINLRTLSITNCDGLSELPEKIVSLANLELLRLQACTGLLGLPDSISGLLNLRILDISVCSSLVMLPDRISKLQRLERIDMRGCINLSELPSSARDLVCLKEVICCEDTARLWVSDPRVIVPEKVHDLEFLQIYS